MRAAAAAGGLGESLTPAEAAARQVEAADVVSVRAVSAGGDWRASGVAAFVGHLDREARVVVSPGGHTARHRSPRLRAGRETRPGCQRPRGSPSAPSVCVRKIMWPP